MVGRVVTTIRNATPDAGPIKPMASSISPAERTPAFRRNESLEALIEQLNGVLVEAHTRSTEAFTAPNKPVVFVVGGPRSGTTLMMQWLAASGLFGYPSNLVARFFRAPYVGALIHEMLLNPKFAFRDDFADLRPYTFDSDFSSHLGKTVGVAAPNVFWYFWRRFFPFAPFPQCPHLSAEQLRGADTAGFVRDLAALEAAFGKPFALKGMIVNWNLADIDALFDKVLFVHVKRQPAYQMGSILAGRAQFRGDRRLWWSFQPREREAMPDDATPEEQVAAQIHSARRAVGAALAKMDEHRWIEVDYEDFCADPKPVYRAIAARLAHQSFELPSRYAGPETFLNTNVRHAHQAPALDRTFSDVGRRYFGGD